MIGAANLVAFALLLVGSSLAFLARVAPRLGSGRERHARLAHGCLWAGLAAVLLSYGLWLLLAPEATSRPFALWGLMVVGLAGGGLAMWGLGTWLAHVWLPQSRILSRLWAGFVASWILLAAVALLAAQPVVTGGPALPRIGFLRSADAFWWAMRLFWTCFALLGAFYIVQATSAPDSRTRWRIRWPSLTLTCLVWVNTAMSTVLYDGGSRTWLSPLVASCVLAALCALGTLTVWGPRYRATRESTATEPTSPMAQAWC